ncbi:hypothetical protein [Solirubrum puertoriconensis]|uniref:Uncharacterized protein n=1 Tax=Solirubrum puertoriconensis TaxID=1751427 RepID=A0A9X0HM03_SOLP1|nr:hypothetical protein [Solirubrum puertoriconensis]KUG08424.1 hypothetical protein ASU33_09665 [Solirubrum puertoriconensis]
MKTIHRLVSLLMFMLLALLVALPFAVAFAQAPAERGQLAVQATTEQQRVIAQASSVSDKQ